MATVSLSPAALQDLERLVDFLLETDAPAARETAALIVKGLRVLEQHPLIGRPLHVNRRELVIFRGRTGYLAQYHYDFAIDEVIVLAIRHQREVGE
jgi:plasmid stabilization system protein ParE